MILFQSSFNMNEFLLVWKKFILVWNEFILHSNLNSPPLHYTVLVHSSTFWFQERRNAFVSMCKFNNNVGAMTLKNCDLFKRSFTNQGLGYTFNNERERILMKENYRSNSFSPNTKINPSNMISGNPEHSLHVIIENNAEEIERYESTKIITDSETTSNVHGDVKYKPKKISVLLHNPREPADIRSSSFKIPLGHSTTIYITPKARRIDDTGKELTEIQRHCKLDEETSNLDIFNIYTKTACMFECNLKLSMKKCGCIPWDYPTNNTEQVCTQHLILFINSNGNNFAGLGVL